MTPTHLCARVQLIRLGLTFEAALLKIFPGAACWEAFALFVTITLGWETSWASYDIAAGARPASYLAPASHTPLASRLSGCPLQVGDALGVFAGSMLLATPKTIAINEAQHAAFLPVLSALEPAKPGGAP